MKNQVRPVCSPKDKIRLRPDKLQRCRQLPLEQAKLRQILENKREGLLIWKWFDRWNVAESLCDRLCGKIDHDLISQQHESWCGKPQGWIYPSYMLNDGWNVNHSLSASVTNAESLPESSPQLIENSSRARRSQHGMVFCSQILFSSATVAFRTNFLSLADFKSNLSWTNLKLPSSATWP